MAYVWTLCHVPIAIGLMAVGKTIGVWFLPVAVGIVFATAYVVPYFAFRRLYRIEGPAADDRH